MLARYYNEILKHNYFPFSWLDVLDLMIEKRKYNKTDKLRKTYATHADLKLLMRMFLGIRTGENYENDARIPKLNCGSRKFYSIES